MGGCGESQEPGTNPGGITLSKKQKTQGRVHIMYITLREAINSTDDPRCTKSNTDKLEPNRAKLRRANDDAIVI